MPTPSILVGHLFCQLFSRPARGCLRKRIAYSNLLVEPIHLRRGYAFARRRQDDEDGGSRWQQRIDAFPKDMSKQLREYPKVTAYDLRHRTNRPRRVKMLTRDFIEGKAERANQVEEPF